MYEIKVENKVWFKLGYVFIVSVFKLGECNFLVIEFKLG